MVRIIVTTEQNDHLLLDEQVGLVHLSEGHAAEQLMQRLRWAVSRRRGRGALAGRWRKGAGMATGTGTATGTAGRTATGTGTATATGDRNGSGHRSRGDA